MKNRRTLTEKERRWAFKHAKEHAVEALRDVLTDEHHSFIKVNDVIDGEIHALVMRHLERWFKSLRRETFLANDAASRAAP